MLTWRENYTDDSQVKSLCYFNYNYFAGEESAKTPNKMDGPQRLALPCLQARVPDGARARPSQSTPFTSALVFLWYDFAWS